MKLFLDTTIQIDRIFGSRPKRKAIQEVCAKKECWCSTYVLGEFYANIVNDAVCICHFLHQENDLNEAERRIVDFARNRQANRMHKIFLHLRNLYDNNLEMIRCEMESWLDDLLHLFYRGIQIELTDETGCQRAKAYVDYRDGIPFLKGANCKKTSCQCGIEEFWIAQQPMMAQIPLVEGMNDKVKSLLEEIQKSIYNVKGNHCRTLGDTIIVLEARNHGGEVCSTNKKDYLPLCQLFQVTLQSPDYQRNGVYKLP